VNSNHQPKRCPQCHALVVDRRSLTCTTCQADLPKEWVMSKQQVAKVAKLEAQSRALHKQEMQSLDPRLNPNIPPVIKFLDMGQP
jgi:hypothetical protein